MTEPLVALHYHGPAAVVELDRPERLNALSLALIDQVVAAVEEADARADIRGVVISGAGRAFSAGADLHEALEIADAQAALTYVTRLRRLTSAIESASKPVVAAIHGVCYTGGLELALACDRRVVSTDATFSVSSARIGSVAGLGGTQRLPRLVGSAVARDLLMTGRVFKTDEAQQIGLVDELVEPGRAVDAARAWIEQVAESAPLAVWLAKLAVHVGTEMPLDAALQFEGLLTSLAFMTEDRREGMAAVLDKRRPEFKGR